MKKYLICNIGCDDATETEMELSNEEFNILLKFAKQNNKTGGGCKPVIGIYSEYYIDDNGYYHTGKWVDNTYVDFKDLTEEGNDDLSIRQF